MSLPGVKLRRQGGAVRQNIHPMLMAVDPVTYRKTPIKVNAVTPTGKKAVAWLVKCHKQQLQQQDVQEQQANKQHTQQPLEQHLPGSTLEHSNESTAAGGMSQQIAADAEFMLMLSRLQHWKNKYGSCHVPTSVFDNQELAQWAQNIRKQRRRQQQQIPPPMEHLSDGHGETGNVKCKEELLEQSPVAPGEALLPWQLEELNATGFIWQPTQVNQAWFGFVHELLS